MTKKTFLFVCLLSSSAPDIHAYNHRIPVSFYCPYKQKKTKKRKVMENQTGKISFSSPKYHYCEKNSNIPIL